MRLKRVGFVRFWWRSQVIIKKETSANEVSIRNRNGGVIGFLALLTAAYSAIAGSVSYEYNVLGRLERVVYDDTVIEFFYDAAGNCTSRVVALGA